MSKEKTWIYKSNGGAEISVVIKPTTKVGVPDGFGGFSHMTTSKPVYLRFIGGTAVINEAFAKKVGHSVEVLAEWANNQPQIGGTYFLAQSPDMSLSKEEVDKIEGEAQQKLKAKSKVLQGTRAIK